MSNTATSELSAPAPIRSTDGFCFRWWYKGKTPAGNTMKLTGKVMAADASEACDKVEKQMRHLWPTVRWMQGREIEGNGVTFGPTVQKLKGRKQNAAMSDCAGGKLKS